MESGTLITAENIRVERDGKTILEDLSLALCKDEIVTVVGPNGAGKTTLALVLLGVMEPTSGLVTQADHLTVGYVPQRIQISGYLPMSVKRLMHLAKRTKESEILNSLEKLEAAHLLDRQVHNLSGGELQRVMLARAVLRKPDLLVLDEPAQGMDIGGQIKFYNHVKQIRDHLHCGILLISHDLTMVMAATDRVLCIHRHICCSGKPDTISQDPAFIELFGKQAAQTLAMYHHHHDHTHGGWDKGTQKEHQDVG